MPLTAMHTLPGSSFRGSMLEEKYEQLSTEELLEYRTKYRNEVQSIMTEWAIIKRILLKRKMYLQRTINDLHNDRLDEVLPIDNEQFFIH